MKHGVLLQILIALVVSIAGAYGMTSIQVATIDTREQTRAAETERAIERVSKMADDRVNREIKQVDEKLNKIDENVQWLIKQQIETRALVNRLSQE